MGKGKRSSASRRALTSLPRRARFSLFAANDCPLRLFGPIQSLKHFCELRKPLHFVAGERELAETLPPPSPKPTLDLCSSPKSTATLVVASTFTLKLSSALTLLRYPYRGCEI